MKNTLTSLFAALLLVTAVVPGGVAAQADTTDDGGITDTFDGLIVENRAIQAAIGGYQNARYEAASWSPVDVPLVGPDDPPTASEQAAALRSFSDGKRAALIDYANAQAADEVDVRNHDVVKLALESSDDEAVVYVVSNTTDGEVTNVSVVNETSQQVDYTVDLNEHATREVVDDAEYAYENFVVENRSVDALEARFGSKYAGNVEIQAGDA